MPIKRIGIIVQARMASTRLPGKVLMNLGNNESVLDILIKRLKLSKNLNELIIATTPDERNQVIVDIAKKHKVSYFIGSEENVLERYYKAAEKFNIDIVVRVTSDCPFIDPKVLDDMINYYMANDYDYIRNRDLNFTTNIPLGMDIEMCSLDVLEEVYKKATTRAEKEHVTYYILTHEEEFNIYYYDLEDLKKIKGLRLTIDEMNDLIMCRAVYKKIIENGYGLDFTIYDIIRVIEQNPELININKNVKQKKA